MKTRNNLRMTASEQYFASSSLTSKFELYLLLNDYGPVPDLVRLKLLQLG